MTRKIQLNIRVSVEEKKKIQELAKSYGMSLGGFLRLLLKLGKLPKIPTKI